MWKLKQLVEGDGGDRREESFFEDDDSDNALFSLSTTQRMYAFGGFLVGGLACMFLSFIVFAKPIKFAVLFTFGNVLAVGSTAFLIGPRQQLSMMFDSVRVYATAIYIGFVVLALVFALWIRVGFLAIFLQAALHPSSAYENQLAKFNGLVNAATVCSNKLFSLIMQIHSTLLTVIAMICEICALFWYSLSYIPFARSAVSSLTIRLFDTEV